MLPVTTQRAPPASAVARYTLPEGSALTTSMAGRRSVGTMWALADPEALGHDGW